MLAPYQLSNYLLAEAVTRTLQVSFCMCLLVGALYKSGGLVELTTSATPFDVLKIVIAAVAVHAYRWIVLEWNAIDDSIMEEHIGHGDKEEADDELHDQRLMSWAVYASGTPFAKLQVVEKEQEQEEDEEEVEDDSAIATTTSVRRRSSYTSSTELLQRQDSAVWRTVLATGATFNKTVVAAAGPTGRRSFVALESS